MHRATDQCVTFAGALAVDPDHRLAGQRRLALRPLRGPRVVRVDHHDVGRIDVGFGKVLGAGQNLTRNKE